MYPRPTWGLRPGLTIFFTKNYRSSSRPHPIAYPSLNHFSRFRRQVNYRKNGQRSQGKHEARAQREGPEDRQVADQEQREGHEHPVPDLQTDFPPDHQGACPPRARLQQAQQGSSRVLPRYQRIDNRPGRTETNLLYDITG